MAKWILYRNRRNFLTLLYRNLVSKQVFCCGELRLDTPTDMIIRWVMDQESVQPGDIIKLQDGSVIQVLNQQARA